MAHNLEAGCRVKFLTDFDVATDNPVFIEAGELGTLVRIDQGGAFWVKMDDMHVGLEIWDNEVRIWDCGPDDVQPWDVIGPALSDQLLAEFPDYDGCVPDLGPDWVEDSWHNDACPSFSCDAIRLRLWVDYVDPAKREFTALPRYTLHRIDEDSAYAGDLLNSDSWEEVATYINGWAMMSPEERAAFLQND